MFTGKSKKSKNEGKKKRSPHLDDKLFDDVNRLKHDSGESDMVIPGEITKPPEEDNDKDRYVKKQKFSIFLFLAYVFSPIVAYIYLKSRDGLRDQFHGKQALFMGVINLVLLFLVIGIFTWIYTIYIGFKAANWEEPEVPILTKRLREI